LDAPQPIFVARGGRERGRGKGEGEAGEKREGKRRRELGAFGGRS